VSVWIRLDMLLGWGYVEEVVETCIEVFVLNVSSVSFPSVDALWLLVFVLISII
jgi:hypothetical protein